MWKTVIILTFEHTFVLVLWYMLMLHTFAFSLLLQRSLITEDEGHSDTGRPPQWVLGLREGSEEIYCARFYIAGTPRPTGLNSRAMKQGNVWSAFWCALPAFYMAWDTRPGKRIYVIKTLQCCEADTQDWFYKKKHPLEIFLCLFCPLTKNGLHFDCDLKNFKCIVNVCHWNVLTT